MTNNDSLGKMLASHYGLCTAQYSGTGKLHFRDGLQVDCRFGAVQLARGSTLLICCDLSPELPTERVLDRFWGDTDVYASKFEGTTEDGWRICADEGMYDCAFCPELPTGNLSGSWQAFTVRELSVSVSDDQQPAYARFGLTNLSLHGTLSPNGRLGSANRVLPIEVEYGGLRTQVTISPVDDYLQKIRRLQMLRDVDVTCEVIVELDGSVDSSTVKDIVDALCYVLSVARGVKIQWIYCNYCDRNGTLMSRTHYSRVTKRYAQLEAIDPLSHGGEDTRRFVESALPIFQCKRDIYKLSRGTIDWYLEAKAETDYIEMRGAKLAVAMEALKEVIGQEPDGVYQDFIINPDTYKDLFPKLKEAVKHVLCSHDIPPACRQDVYKNLGALNRKPFSDLLCGLCRSLGLEIAQREMELFVASRNSLVHTGDFYCKTATLRDRSKCEPLPNAGQEYFFLVDFLDRVFLKLFGYSGQYESWFSSEPPERKHLP